MPTSQSASDRQSAEAYNPSYAAPSRRRAKPSAMASSVMEEIHSRNTGFLQRAKA